MRFKSSGIWLLLLIVSVLVFAVVGAVSASPEALFLSSAAPIFFAGPVVKSVAKIAEKWAKVTPQRSAEYEDGVKNPVRDWAKNTADANAAYKAGVTEAVNKDRFLKGVQKAGTEKWKTKAATVGPARFSQGVTVAQPDFEKGFAPFRDVIEKTTLPPRFAKGDPRNIDRVRVIAAALSAAKKV